ncbi:hypothetical protein AAHB53_05645 [Niallia circulans]
MKQLLFIAIIFTFISGSYIYIPSIANAETISKEETTTVATRKFAVDKKENVKASDESADITNNEKNYWPVLFMQKRRVSRLPVK